MLHCKFLHSLAASLTSKCYCSVLCSERTQNTKADDPRAYLCFPCTEPFIVSPQMFFCVLSLANPCNNLPGYQAVLLTTSVTDVVACCDMTATDSLTITLPVLLKSFQGHLHTWFDYIKPHSLNTYQATLYTSLYCTGKSLIC